MTLNIRKAERGAVNQRLANWSEFLCGEQLRERIREITRGLVLGFFDQTLRGTGEIPEYPEVKMERWPAN